MAPDPRPETDAGRDQSGTSSASMAQADVARLRQTVLGGRGPGASRSEFLRATRGRTLVGGRPVAQEREAVARDAAAARRDADGLLLYVATARSRLEGDLQNLHSRANTHPPRHRVLWSLSMLARSRRVRVAIGWIALLLIGRSAWRSTRSAHP